MGDVIEFPLKDEKAVRDALRWVRSTYEKAGLTEEGIQSALTEFEPILREFAVRFEAPFEVQSAGLTQSQADAIISANNECIQRVVAHHSQQLGLALNYIAGLIGRTHHD